MCDCGPHAQHLWREVRGGPTESTRQLLLTDAAPCQAEIREHGVTALIDDAILTLEIPIHDATLVKILKSQVHLGSVYLRHGLLQLFLALDHTPQVTAWAELKDKHKKVRGLKGKVQGHDVGMTGKRQDVPLCSGVAQSVLLQNLAFPKDLHGILALVTQVSNLPYLSE
jgi:hypothetical protein